MSLKQVSEHPVFMKILGQPVNTGWMVSGNFEVSGTSGEPPQIVFCKIPVVCQGSNELRTYLEVWQLELTDEDHNGGESQRALVAHGDPQAEKGTFAADKTRQGLGCIDTLKPADQTLVESELIQGCTPLRENVQVSMCHNIE